MQTMKSPPPYGRDYRREKNPDFHAQYLSYREQAISSPGAVFSYKLRYIVGFGLVEMAISTNPKPTIYHNLYENTGPGRAQWSCMVLCVIQRQNHAGCAGIEGERGATKAGEEMVVR